MLGEQKGIDVGMGLDPTAAEALTYSVQQARAAIPSAVQIGLYLPDEQGHLQLTHLDGGTDPTFETGWASLRNSVLETATSATLDLSRPPNSSLLGIPMKFHERAFGVLAVIAARESLRQGQEILERIAAQAGAVLAASASARDQYDRLGLGLALTAHELRSPVVAAQVAIAYALNKGVPNPASSDLLQRSHRELEQLSSLVDGLLRWGVGDAELEEEPMDLLEVARDAAATCTWETGGGVVGIWSDRTEVGVQGDRAQLKTAIANLVRNALAHAPDGTEVQIGVEAGDQRVRLRVSDAGPGVPDDEQEVIFEPLVLSRNGPSSDKSRGLGLFITRRIVEAHGGATWVEPGSGATFVIELPRAREAASRAS